jgi:hypothetical protein
MNEIEDSPHGKGTSEACRYGCGNPVTHFCLECHAGVSGRSGYYCTQHAMRHDAIVRSNGGNVFAQQIRRGEGAK